MTVSTIFIGGISAVFFGMALIYLAIKITAVISEHFPEKEKQS